MSYSPSHQYIEVPDTASPLRIVQFTDCHLSKNPGGRLLGMDTDHSVQAVIEQVRQDQFTPDLVLATGDLADAGAVEAYQRLRAYFDKLCPRQFWLPGNHDDCEVMLSLAEADTLMPFELRVGNWQILLLNSQIPGKVGGHLGAEQLQRIDQALNAAGDLGLHSLLCLHHQPLPIGCEWLDEQKVRDGEEFLQIVEGHSHAKAVLWGHVHQQVDRQLANCRLLATPSTCVQFAPGSQDFQADELPPGYRWLELHSDGRLETGVSRVQGVTFELNLQQRGYL